MDRLAEIPWPWRQTQLCPERRPAERRARCAVGARGRAWILFGRPSTLQHDPEGRGQRLARMGSWRDTAGWAHCDLQALCEHPGALLLRYPGAQQLWMEPGRGGVLCLWPASARNDSDLRAPAEGPERPGAVPLLLRYPG